MPLCESIQSSSGKTAAHLSCKQAPDLLPMHNQIVRGAHMLVVSADTVDSQPHSAKDADDDRSDWPIQHLAAGDSKS